MTKICTQCKIEQDILNFNKRKLKYSIGHRSYCKVCKKQNYPNSRYYKPVLNIGRFNKEKSGPKINENYEQIIKLRKELYSYDAISILLNMPRSTVATICQKEFKNVFVPKL